MTDRSAEEYADFLIPHVAASHRLLDAGCGDGSITVGLADRVAAVVGVDLDEDELARAAARGVENAAFVRGDVYALDFPDAHFDACLCHSLLEALERPVDALREIRRVLVPGGVCGASSVEYGGLILGGPHERLLRRFYAVREELWQVAAGSDPYLGRTLRALVAEAGFERVAATAKYFSYGTTEAVRAFAADRAAECRGGWYAEEAEARGLATADELAASERAWLEWGAAPGAFAAFAWCRAVCFKAAGRTVTSLTA